VRAARLRLCLCCSLLFVATYKLESVSNGYTRVL
jgi:hypothetical protein